MEYQSSSVLVTVQLFVFHEFYYFIHPEQLTNFIDG